MLATDSAVVFVMVVLVLLNGPWVVLVMVLLVLVNID